MNNPNDMPATAYVLIAAAIIGLLALYGECAHGDWSRGVPGIECRATQ